MGKVYQVCLNKAKPFAKLKLETIKFDPAKISKEFLLKLGQPKRNWLERC